MIHDPYSEMNVHVCVRFVSFWIILFIIPFKLAWPQVHERVLDDVFKSFHFIHSVTDFVYVYLQRTEWLSYSWNLFNIYLNKVRCFLCDFLWLWILWLLQKTWITQISRLCIFLQCSQSSYLMKKVTEKAFHCLYYHL